VIVAAAAAVAGCHRRVLFMRYDFSCES